LLELASDVPLTAASNIVLGIKALGSDWALDLGIWDFFCYHIQMINIDELQKVDLRVGIVTAAERVDGSEKLLKLMVDLGEPALRQILSGVAKWYAPEDMVGKRIVVVANLEPRMMMGMESNGMLLAAHGADGEAVLLTSMGDVPSGARIT